MKHNVMFLHGNWFNIQETNVSFVKCWKVSVWSFADYIVFNESHHNAKKEPKEPV